MVFYDIKFHTPWKAIGLTLFMNWANSHFVSKGPIIWKESYESVLLITCKGRFIKASCCLYIMHATILRVCSKAKHELATFTDHEGFWRYNWHFVYIKQQRIIVACNTQYQCHERQEWTLTVYSLFVSALSWHPVYLDERTVTWLGYIWYMCFVKGIWTLQSINIKRDSGIWGRVLWHLTGKLHCPWWH